MVLNCLPLKAIREALTPSVSVFIVITSKEVINVK